jgi:DNA polymerase III epsilon subunit family exonuclease
MKYSMTPFPNLVSESILVNATIEYLAAAGGRATAVRVVDRVMKIRRPEPSLAAKLAADLVSRDTRLRMHDDVVEYVDGRETPINLAEAGYVIFDLETTGAKAPPCRITEIGAYRVRNGEVTDEFHTLVDPGVPIPQFITTLTGISDDMVSGAPAFRDIADDLIRFIGDSVLVAHNARFDMGFLNHEIGRVYEDYRLGNQSLCTVQLSRKLLPDIENHKLNTVARHLSIDLLHHHRAADDALATAKIFINLLNDLLGRGIRDLETARKFTLKKQIC